MVACYSMVMAAAAVVVGKVASGACSFEATSRFSRVQISLVLREGHLLMDLPIKISPKMVFVSKTDSLGRDNLIRPIWTI